MAKQTINGQKRPQRNTFKAYKASSPCSPVLILTASSKEKTKILPSPTGLLSVVVQHETDHLDGKLMVDYISSTKRERIRSKLLKLKKQKR